MDAEKKENNLKRIYELENDSDEERKSFFKYMLLNIILKFKNIRTSLG